MINNPCHGWQGPATCIYICKRPVSLTEGEYGNLGAQSVTSLTGRENGYLSPANPSKPYRSTAGVVSLTGDEEVGVSLIGASRGIM
jgi:hypothetical protein